jgi:Flp pilus assembly protein TadD
MRAGSTLDAKSSREAARLNNLGTALMNQQLLERAAGAFSEAAGADPHLAAAQINQGIAYLYLQRLPEARKALDNATRAAPRDPHGWYALGLLERTENQSRKALEAFEKVITIDPADPDAYYMAGSVEVDLNALPAAEADFRKALAINPSHASALFGLARVLRRKGDVAGAQKIFDYFQHVSYTKSGAPFSHTYGEEGRYGRVEDTVPAPSAVAPMIPVTFASGPRSQPAAVPATSLGGACLIDLPRSPAPSLILMSAGEEAVRIFNTIPQAGGPPRFVEQPGSATGLHVPGIGVACAVGDYDNDGLPDIAAAVTSPDGTSRMLLFHNLGGGSPGQVKFEEVAAKTGITTTNRPSSLTFVDFDHDGDLDLFITGAPLAPGGADNALWRNNGNQTFTKWTQPAGLEGKAPTSAAVLSDLNNDRAVDLVTAGAAPAPTWFGNRRDGPFSAAPLFPERLPPSTSTATVDFNQDDWMDVLLTHNGTPGVTLWRNVEGRSFERVLLPLAGVTRAYAAVPVDFDNDGWIDLALIVQTKDGPQLRVLRNLGSAGFADVSGELGLAGLKLHAPRGLIAADLGRSGAADLLVTDADGSFTLVSNLGGNRNHSLRISLVGLADNKSGIGAKVEVFANGLRQKWEATGQPEILAGLGTADKADFVRLLWPTGVPQDEIDIAASQPLTVTELDRRGSSCPTLFAWDGEKYAFISDVIGAAVVGHWTSPTQHNTPDPDEWIKIDGSQLRERDGRLSLRFGEPMEEVNFVDQVRLVAVDHASGVAVYRQEVFLSEPPFATGSIIVAAAAHPLAGAWDDRGHDVLALLSQPPTRRRDPDYVKDFTNLTFAGFANPHTLTVDLGPWSPDRPLRLLLHGFIEYFSASSMYSAWQAGLAPIPPYIEEQMADDSWRRVIDDMGFPAGLPRTVTVDLTGKLAGGVHRLRITTNLQIYWDRALVDNEHPAPGPGTGPGSAFRQTELPLAQATLAFRGYPRQIDGRTPGDLTYNYRQMSATGPFIPHRGGYTRYGDVTPLLRAVDDKFVIFGTGEDMDLEFPSKGLPPLPQGWTRDYFFYANGFVKDMDFYEASPFEVGSLPFHGMSGYPYLPSEHYPADADHTAYQLEYNTRFESGATSRSYQFDYRP